MYEVYEKSMHTRMSIYLNRCVYEHVLTRMLIICTHIYVYIYICVYIYIYMCVCVCACVCFVCVRVFDLCVFVSVCRQTSNGHNFVYQSIQNLT